MLPLFLPQAIIEAKETGGAMSKFWTVRTGRSGERTEWSFANNVVGGGWDQIPDLTNVTDKEELRKLVQEHRGGSKQQVANATGQLWTLRTLIGDGDFVALPIRSTSQVAFGKVVGGYKYIANEEDPSRRHVLSVEWIETGISKTQIKQDLLYQLGSALTVFRVGNNDADYRLTQIMNGHRDPGARTAINTPKSNADADVFDSPNEEPGESVNVEEIAQDEIARLLQEDFKGHELSDLIAALLAAEGFECRNSPPGADGGVDILAGKGPLGMDSPKLVVQVKSQTSAVSDVVLQQLNGAIHRYSADQALLVTFGGVTAPAKNYLETQYFNIRVWTMGDILTQIYENYERLDGEMKSRLPLKQIWVPISEN